MHVLLKGVACCITQWKCVRQPRSTREKIYYLLLFAKDFYCIAKEAMLLCTRDPRNMHLLQKFMIGSVNLLCVLYKGIPKQKITHTMMITLLQEIKSRKKRTYFVRLQINVWKKTILLIKKEGGPKSKKWLENFYSRYRPTCLPSFSPIG